MGGGLGATRLYTYTKRRKFMNKKKTRILPISFLVLLTLSCSASIPPPGPDPLKLTFSEKSCELKPNDDLIVYTMKLECPLDIRWWNRISRSDIYIYKKAYITGIKLLELEYTEFKLMESDGVLTSNLLSRLQKADKKVFELGLYIDTCYSLMPPVNIFINAKEIEINSDNVEPIISYSNNYFWKDDIGHYREQYPSVQLDLTQNKVWDLRKVFDLYFPTTIKFEIIESESGLPINNAEVIIKNIDIKDFLKADKLADKFANKHFAERKKQLIQESINKFKSTKFISDKNGYAFIKLAPVPDYINTLDVMIRAEGHKFFEGSINNLDNTNYLIKLPRLGSKIDIEIVEPLVPIIKEVK